MTDVRYLSIEQEWKSFGNLTFCSLMTTAVGKQILIPLKRNRQSDEWWSRPRRGISGFIIRSANRQTQEKPQIFRRLKNFSIVVLSLSTTFHLLIDSLFKTNNGSDQLQLACSNELLIVFVRWLIIEKHWKTKSQKQDVGGPVFGHKVLYIK